MRPIIRPTERPRSLRDAIGTALAVATGYGIAGAQVVREPGKGYTIMRVPPEGKPQYVRGKADPALSHPVLSIMACPDKESRHKVVIHDYATKREIKITAECCQMLRDWLTEPLLTG